jgi:hypothetical protein
MQAYFKINQSFFLAARKARRQTKIQSIPNQKK